MQFSLLWLTDCPLHYQVPGFPGSLVLLWLALKHVHEAPGSQLAVVVPARLSWEHGANLLKLRAGRLNALARIRQPSASAALPGSVKEPFNITHQTISNTNTNGNLSFSTFTSFQFYLTETNYCIFWIVKTFTPLEVFNVQEFFAFSNSTTISTQMSTPKILSHKIQNYFEVSESHWSIKPVVQVS